MLALIAARPLALRDLGVELCERDGGADGSGGVSSNMADIRGDEGDGWILTIGVGICACSADSVLL